MKINKQVVEQQPVRAPGFGYAFPAIRGIQAGREYYISMCPLRLIPKIFLFDEDEMVPELRAQRTLNRARIPEITQYILDHPRDYVFSAITASIDGEAQFIASGETGEGRNLGALYVSMNAQFILNDGQHRRAAIENALRERPELADETIAVVFFMDRGLSRCQQMFADLNRYAVRASKSLGVLYDTRDDRAQLVKTVVKNSNFFRDMVETERTTLSARSKKLFTLSSLYAATKSLLEDVSDRPFEEQVAIAQEFWEEVAKQIPEWVSVRNGGLTSGEVRRDHIHSHGTVLQAMGRTGRALLAQDPANWRARLQGLSAIDWSRKHTKLWEGRAMIAGRVSKAEQNVTLTTNVLKRAVGLELTPEEWRIEEAATRGA